MKPYLSFEIDIKKRLKTLYLQPLIQSGMPEIKVLLPKMGESVAEATITKWLKSVGDQVDEEESIVEIATDKVDSEIPSPESGVITRILFKEGEIVKVGEPIAIIDSPGLTDKPGQKTTFDQVRNSRLPISESGVVISPGEITNGKTQPAETFKTFSDFPAPGISEYGSRFFSPLVKNIAKQEGIPLNELSNVPGSGKDGRITKQDVFEYIEKRKSLSHSAPSIRGEGESGSSFTGTVKTPQIFEEVGGGLSEMVEMSRMGRLMADHMVMSKKISPHVTSFVEADVTNLVKWREKAKIVFERSYGEKISFTPIFIEAVVKALKDFPMVNASVEGYKIVLKKFINIGMATALPGNLKPGNQAGLIVPVIKNADRLNLLGLAKSVNDLANRARLNKLNPDEVQGGTFSITNIGTFGNLMGTPIISQPQVAILATGIIRKKPAVIETPFGDTIGIRHMMFLSLSYDHRVVDGALGGGFLKRVADYLGKFDLEREI